MQASRSNGAIGCNGTGLFGDRERLNAVFVSICMLTVEARDQPLID